MWHFSCLNFFTYDLFHVCNLELNILLGLFNFVPYLNPLPNVTRHSKWWPSTVTPSIDKKLHQYFTLLLTWTLLPNLTFYLITRGFHRSFVTGAAWQQRSLTPPETWSCPTLGLSSVLILRPTTPELVLFPDFEFRTSLGISVFRLNGIRFLLVSSVNQVRNRPDLTDLWEYSKHLK